jgi:hypothetical protein
VTEEVAQGSENPSEESNATPPEAPESVASAAPTESESEATWKKRLAGKDSALTSTIRERDAAQQRLRELEEWKAQQERGSLTELERMRLELEDRDRRLVEAEETARSAKMEARFPAAFAATDGKLLDETALAKLEAALSRGEPTSAPVVSNSAPKRPGEPPAPKTSKEIEAELRAIPNPYQGF